MEVKKNLSGHIFPIIKSVRSFHAANRQYNLNTNNSFIFFNFKLIKNVQYVLNKWRLNCSLHVQLMYYVTVKKSKFIQYLSTISIKSKILKKKMKSMEISLSEIFKRWYRIKIYFDKKRE